MLSLLLWIVAMFFSKTIMMEMGGIVPTCTVWSRHKASSTQIIDLTKNKAHRSRITAASSWTVSIIKYSKAVRKKKAAVGGINPRLEILAITKILIT
jgi:hypothetical protein